MLHSLLKNRGQNKYKNIALEIYMLNYKQTVKVCAFVKI